MTTADFVALLRLASRPWPELAELIEDEGGVANALDKTLGGGQLSLTEPSSADELVGRAASEIAGWEQHGIHVLTALDDDYPANLRTVHDHPPLLFVQGQLDRGDERSL